MEIDWHEVRSLYPNQFVKLCVLKSSIEGNKVIIEDMIVIHPVNDGDATRELFKSKASEVVYHTINEEIFIIIRKGISLRDKYNRSFARVNNCIS